MSAPPYMKLYVADYLGDTHHLGAMEHGAYLLLLMAMWRAGGSLPAADANLAKLARCTPDQWVEVREAVIPFFKRSRNRLTHKRLAAEMAKYESISGKRKEAGKAGGVEKAKKNNAPDLAIATGEPSNCRHNQNQNQNHIISTISEARAPEWKTMLEEARAAAGDVADMTQPAMHHVADLRALIEPNTGEPCTWDEVVTAIEMTAMRQRARGKQIRSWAWVANDAFSLRDKRLNAAAPQVADVIQMRPAAQAGASITDRIAAENAEARRRALEN